MTAPGGQATPTGLAAVWAGLEALEKRQNDLAAAVGRDVQMQADRIEKLEERVLKLENPLHMPLVKLHERIDKLEERAREHHAEIEEWREGMDAAWAEWSEGVNADFKGFTARQEEALDAFVQDHADRIEALESRLDSTTTTLLAKVHKLEDQLDVMRNWQGWAENNVLCGHACRIETLEERVTGVVANTDAEVDNLIRGLNTLIKRVNRMEFGEDDDELRS